jgi:hypothetical protein
MKAPPGHVEPITAGQLRKIIKGLGYCPPSDSELAVLAATLTGWQSCNDAPEWGCHVRVENVKDKGGPARVDKVPPWLRLTFDADKRALGHPRPGMKDKWPIDHPRYGEKDWRKKDCHDLVLDIAPRFRGMMQKANPGRPSRRTCRALHCCRDPTRLSGSAPVRQRRWPVPRARC